MESEPAGAVEVMDTEMLVASIPEPSLFATAPSTASDAARIAWEHANEVNEISDECLKYNAAVHQSIVNAKPWTNDPHYFKSVKISAVALLKMLIHAHSGGVYEIMGILIGKVAHETMIVMDSFPLPVQGTETRVNAQSEAYEFMALYTELVAKAGRRENVLGWYHSHPGYGCWLSGIDVSTQHTNQTYQEPFVAIVIDPTRTVSYGKVNLGAFRTYPEGYKPPDEGPSEYQSIPMDKIEDFGVHCKRYYSLEVSYFKSSLEKSIINMLWNKYWVNALNSDSTVAQLNHLTDLTRDLADKVENAAINVDRMNSDNGRLQDKLAKCSKDASKISLEQVNAIIGHMIKDDIFKVY
ncbi:COP9 signalosome complex subunit [Echinococcus granulosus]|uniref:COP9 signalosome complex subunit n=1 Tax=Echinococcus granulosus TaxID=6210 RepID=W6VAE7_ECHGR|nr:COP9 signalosome complex subunit [Echinococcus granulosus]EUB63749.1 COP9 signalosome complex subunit [Echinococcus granulosus]